MPDDLVERLPDALIEFLHDACVAGCSCQTKSPEIVFHEPTCHYRLHVQSIDRITALTARLAALEQATPEEVRDTMLETLANNMPSWGGYEDVPPSEIFPTRQRYKFLADWCERVADAALDAIAAPLRAQGAVWQPIETAPKSLTTEPLLLWDGHDYLIGFWATSGGSYKFEGWTTGWETAGGYDVGYAMIRPTHWTPLPESPARIRAGGSGG